MISEEKKAQKEDTDSRTGKKAAPQPAGSSQQVEKKEGRKGADREDGKVQSEYIFTENARIGIVKNRNKQGSQQDSKAQGSCGTWPVLFRSQKNPCGIEQHWEKYQFHMLPYGFADRDKQARNGVLTGPVIEKMGKGAKKKHEEKAGDGLVFYEFFVVVLKKIHIRSPQDKNVFEKIFFRHILVYAGSVFL